MVCGFFSCGTRALDDVGSGSVAVMHGFSCPVSSGIVVPPPGVKPTSPALQDRFLTTDYQGSPEELTLNVLSEG